MLGHRSKKRVHLGATFVVACVLLIGLPGLADAAPPSNDDFADAVAVTEPLPFTDTLGTADATIEPEEPGIADFGCGFVASTVWYSFVPSVDMTVAADTVGSNFDTTLAVWQGTDLASLTLVGCADDTRGGVQSSVPFAAEAGAEYRIQVGGFVGDTGSLSFRVRHTAAGFVEGTVTDQDTANPLGAICVFLVDAVFGNNVVLGVTATDGTFRIAARPGSYLVAFIDCLRDRYILEFWDGAPSDATATEIDVVADVGTSGIDADLVRGCPGFGSSGLDQIVGTSGADTLTGTAGREVICGFGGDDVIRGFEGPDFLSGGAGADELHGGDGQDSLSGQAGPDRLFGGAGRDDLRGGLGQDRCDGGPDQDYGQSCEVRLRVER